MPKKMDRRMKPARTTKGSTPSQRAMPVDTPANQRRSVPRTIRATQRA